MSRRGDDVHVAVVCDPAGPVADAVRAYLARHEIDAARWFAPGDVDDLVRALRGGGTWRTIWPNAATWLEALWDGRGPAACWVHSAVTVEFVEDGTMMTPAAVPALAEAWSAWRRRQRRRQAVAGVLLSLLALAAAFLLLMICR